MNNTLLAWIGFHLFLLIALAVDLGFFHKNAHEIKFKEAIKFSLVWLFLALFFNLGIYWTKGSTFALEFFTAYFIEWSLSIDNLFVFLTIFSAFSVPKKQQHRVLFWGIIGALIMRAGFIVLGITLLKYFHWIIYFFGTLLLLTGLKLFFVEKKEEDLQQHWLIRVVKKWFPFTDSFHDGKFLIKMDGRKLGTPLLLVLLIIEVTDVIFAMDSIPAILAITNDSFIVYTSNIFAILGLRSLYFALAGMMSIFRYLKYGLAGVLIFIGIKLCLVDLYKIPTLTSLAVIIILISTAISCSVVIDRKDKKNKSSS